MFELSATDVKNCELCNLNIKINSIANLSVKDSNQNPTRTYEKLQHIYYPNNKSFYIYGIHSGICKEYCVSDEGKEYIDNFYFTGDILGLNAISSNNYEYSSMTLSSMSLCIMPITKIHAAMHNAPELSLQIIDLFTKKLKNTSAIRLTSSAKERVAGFLLSMSQRLKDDNEHEFILPLTQQDISNKIGLSFETLSRILKVLQTENVIRLNKSHEVKITKLSKLKALSGA